MDNWPTHGPSPLIPMPTNGRATQRNSGQEKKICLLCSSKEQQSKKQIQPLCTRIMKVNPVGWRTKRGTVAQGSLFVLQLEGMMCMRLERCVCVCVSCVTKNASKRQRPEEKTTVAVLLLGMQWHRSPAPSARPEYRKCPVRRCRPEPRYL